MTKAEYEQRRQGLIEYLLMKVKSGDFHAVMDAAADVRELDAYWNGLQVGKNG